MLALRCTLLTNFLHFFDCGERPLLVAGNIYSHISDYVIVLLKLPKVSYFLHL